MEILAAGRRAAVPRPLAARAEEATGAVFGLAVLGVIVAWEVARPTLPVPFELPYAARHPGAPTWLGRLPMAVAAIAGSIALYLFIARTAARRPAVYAIAILATAPAWFVHGRTMTGAIVPMACAATVLAGAGIAALDRAAGARRRAVAVAAMVGAMLVSAFSERWGITQRGVVVVAAVPLIAVSTAALLWASATRTPLASRLPLVMLALGGAVVIAGVVVALAAPASDVATLLIGRTQTRSGAGPSAATFDAPVSAVAYGLVPWTSLVPFALARRPRSAGHLAVMIAAVLALAAHAALAPRSGTSTIVGVAFVAGAVALMLASIEDLARPSAALVATVVVVGWLVAHDIGLTPDRALVAFGVTDTAMPAAHAKASSLAIRSSIWLCVVLATAVLVVPRAWLPAGRGLAIVAAGVFAGLVLRVHAYPELLSRLSPGAAFDAWAHLHRANEPLGLVGVDRRSAIFAPATSVVMQNDALAAGRWLAAADHGVAGEPRRFLALAAPDLPRVNAEYRAARGHNVPVLAGREGSTLLGVSVLTGKEQSENPLDAIVLGAPPDRLRPLGAVLEERLEAIGWQLVDESGRSIDAVPRGSRKAHVRIIVRVPHAASGVAASLGGYCTFLHVDHAPSRFSAEHRELPYPMSLWRPGDVVVDDYEVKLPPHFRAGSYRMFWGVGALPCEDDRRMHITSGPSDGRDRVPAGDLEVR